MIIGPAYPYRGGIANFSHALANSLKKQNKNIEIVSFTLQYPSFLFPGKSQFEDSNYVPDFKITRLVNSINPFSWIKTARYINNIKPEVLIFNYWMPFFGISYGFILRFLKKNSNIKTIALCHNIIPHEKSIYDNIFNKFFLKKCFGFVTLSKSVLADLEKFTKSTNKIFAPHPIYDIFGDPVLKNEAKNKLQLDQDTNYLLFFGLVRKYKGLDLALKAISSPKLKGLNLKLIVAGEFYDNPQEYQQLIKDLDIQDRVIIHNRYIPSELLRFYFCAADMVVQTYKTATQSGVTQIAYHFNRPMLVTNVGGLAEIVPNKKVGYVTEKNPEQIAEAIKQFYVNNMESEFVENIKKEKNRFSWSSFVEAILKVSNAD